MRDKIPGLWRSAVLSCGLRPLARGAWARWRCVGDRSDGACPVGTAPEADRKKPGVAPQVRAAIRPPQAMSLDRAPNRCRLRALPCARSRRPPARCPSPRSSTTRPRPPPLARPPRSTQSLTCSAHRPPLASRARRMRLRRQRTIARRGRQPTTTPRQRPLATTTRRRSAKRSSSPTRWRWPTAPSSA